MRIGAQFYTLREHCKTHDDFALSLRRVADIGYRTVQISGTCDYPADWLRDELARNGLSCVLTHIPAARLTGKTEQVIADHRVFGCQHIGLGWWGFNEEEGIGYKTFLERFTPVAEHIRDAGAYFMYHNHDQEFRHMADGRPILAHLAEDMAPDLMGFTIDTFWVQAGGGDPAQWLETLAGRIPCIHLKDYAYGRKMAVLGEGNINFDRVFEAAEAGGTRYMLVEQDDCGGEDPFECLRRSYLYLKANGFE
ncbi:MAG: sugar phosphate isomerase/epimerase [Clostridia bacterium]|nr:sugar phosphate isomerase/epimerase [Clostridia bacterium]